MNNINSFKIISMRMKKRPSLNKIIESPMSMTFTSGFIADSQSKLPPLRPQVRNGTLKRISKMQEKVIENSRKETETTLTDSSMFQSFYQTKGKSWLKPSDYLKDMQDMNLFTEQGLDLQQYEIRLTERVDINMQKMDRLEGLVEKWVSILKKAVSYTQSKRATTDKLLEEVKYWKVLARKFDELEYEFNSEKTLSVLVLMNNFVKVRPQNRVMFEEFVEYKEKVIQLTSPVKKLHLALEEGVAGLVCRLQENSSICQSMSLLKKILLGFKAISQGNSLLAHRSEIIYEKIETCMSQKLMIAAIYPRQLANMSSSKEKYLIINQALSFYGNFISVMEEEESPRLGELILRAQYTREVIVRLLQILCYFQYLYNSKQVLQFSKLFSYVMDFNIYDIEFREEWGQFMEKVDNSMSSKKFEA